MKLHYKGKFKDESVLTSLGTLHPNSTIFREPEYKTFTVIISIASIILFVILIFITFILTNVDLLKLGAPLFLGSVLAMLSAIPHEFLHAICFKEDVYLFQDLAKGVLFVYSPEIMSKRRFIFMSLLPNIIFGFIPYIIFLIRPDLFFFGVFGSLCISMGMGDYINVFNALTQVPKGRKVFMYGTHSYWM